MSQRYDVFLNEHSCGDVWTLGANLEWGSAKARLAEWLARTGFDAGLDAESGSCGEMRQNFVWVIQDLVALKPGKKRTVRHDSEHYSIRHHNPKRLERVKAMEVEQDRASDAQFGRYWDEAT